MSRPKELLCDACGAPLEKDSPTCWLCGASFDASATGSKVSDDAARVLPSSAYSLEALMLVVTLVSVCLGVFTLFPGLGILLAIVIAPVFVRTAMVVRRRTQQGAPVKVGGD